MEFTKILENGVNVDCSDMDKLVPFYSTDMQWKTGGQRVLEIQKTV